MSRFKRGRPTPLEQEQIQDEARAILREKEAGARVPDLAVKWDCSPTTIYRRINDAKWEREQFVKRNFDRAVRP